MMKKNISQWFLFPVVGFGIISALAIYKVSLLNNNEYTSGEVYSNNHTANGNSNIPVMNSAGEEENTNSQAEETSETRTYTDTTLGITFEYPASWGEIGAWEEEGFYNPTGNGVARDEDGNIIFDGPVNHTLSFTQGGNKISFLSGHHAGELLGRGGYWTDTASQFTSKTEAKKWCETSGEEFYTHDSCEIFINKSGITVYGAYTKERSIFDQTKYNLDEYGIHHAGHGFYGIVISNESIMDAGLGRNETELRALVDSIRFID